MSLYEDQTPESIKSDILSRMEGGLQTREGSYTNDMVAAVAYELWAVLMTLGELVSAFYVDETSGPYLDQHAALLGLTRRAGTNAEASIAFAGRDGVTVPAGTAFFTGSGLRYDLGSDVTLENGAGTGKLIAADIGAVYNVAAGEISQISVSISGLSEFAVDAASGGTNEESDEALFARIVLRRQAPSTSGNEAHYQEWALECDGVGAARVIRRWDGPGTVKVLLSGYDGGPVDSSVVSACAAYIETQRPVGAEVAVESVTGTRINVSARLTLRSGMDVETAQAAFIAALTDYFYEGEDSYPTVYYNRVAALLMDVEGVTDYENLLVNGGTSNVSIASDAVPIVGEVIFA